ncbi:hypothetical protein Tco_0375669 [Tanacetum coccineum]
MHKRPAGKIGADSLSMPTSGYLFPLLLLMCLVSIPWHTNKNVSKDPLPKSTEFNVDHYAALVEHSAPFQKFLEPFICLVRMSSYYTLDEDVYPKFLHEMERAEMDLFAFINVVDPTKVKFVERERTEGEKRLMDTIIGCMGFSVAGSGHDAEIELVTEVEDIAAENVIVERPKRQRKKRLVAAGASGSSHHPKKLRGDHRTPSGVATSGKSPSVLKELLASSILNAEVDVTTMATLPFITSSIFAMLEHEGGDHTDFVTRPNLRTVGPSERFVISLDSSHRSSINAAKVEVDSFIRSAASLLVMTEAVITTSIASAPSIPVSEAVTKITSQVQHSIFHDSGSVDTIKPDVAGSSHRLSKELSMGSGEINSEALHEIPKMDYHYLFMEFNVGTARQASLNAEVRMRTEYYLSKRKRLESECENQDELMKGKDAEIETLKAQLLLRKQKLQRSLASVHALETTCFSLCDQVSGYERLKEQIEEFQDAQMNIVNNKVAKLDADLFEMALHLLEKFYPHLLTTISSRRWLLTHGLKLVVIKCLNSPEYIMALGRNLEDIVAYNPTTEVDYNSALRRFREVDFPLLAELSSHKDTRVVDIINLFCLESPLADAPGMSDLQPDIEQLTLPIHRSEDQVVLGETSLSFALSVANSQVPLVEPLSAKNLIGVAGTFGSMPITVMTTTALSTTFAPTSSIPPITLDDYEVVSADGQEDAYGNVQGDV